MRNIKWRGIETWQLLGISVEGKNRVTGIHGNKQKKRSERKQGYFNYIHVRIERLLHRKKTVLSPNAYRPSSCLIRTALSTRLSPSCWFCLSSLSFVGILRPSSRHSDSLLPPTQPLALVPRISSPTYRCPVMLWRTLLGQQFVWTFVSGDVPQNRSFDKDVADCITLSIVRSVIVKKYTRSILFDFLIIVQSIYIPDPRVLLDIHLRRIWCAW